MRPTLEAAALDVNGEHELKAEAGGRLFLPRTPLAALGDAAFREAHGLRFNYVAGAMANGIASVELVIAMAHAGMLGIFGAAGLPPKTVEAAVRRLKRELGELSFQGIRDDEVRDRFGRDLGRIGRKFMGYGTKYQATAVDPSLDAADIGQPTTLSKSTN